MHVGLGRRPGLRWAPSCQRVQGKTVTSESHWAIGLFAVDYWSKSVDPGKNPCPRGSRPAGCMYERHASNAVDRNEGHGCLTGLAPLIFTRTCLFGGSPKWTTCAGGDNETTDWIAAGLKHGAGILPVFQAREGMCCPSLLQRRRRLEIHLLYYKAGAAVPPD